MLLLEPDLKFQLGGDVINGVLVVCDVTQPKSLNAQRWQERIKLEKMHLDTKRESPPLCGIVAHKLDQLWCCLPNMFFCIRTELIGNGGGETYEVVKDLFVRLL